MIFSIHGTDGRYSEEFLQNYTNINILPQIKRISGVGSAGFRCQDVFDAYLVETGCDETI